MKHKSLNISIMKYNKYTWRISLLLSPLFFFSCSVDTLEEVKSLEQIVSFVQVNNGTINLTQDNLIIDKNNKTFKKAFGLALSGFETNQGFNADVEIIYDEVPENCETLNSDECFLTASENSTEKISRITVPAGSSQKAFYLNITNSALENHPGKMIGAKIKISNLDRYTLNPIDSVYITLNTADFAAKKIDITDSYFLNTTFQPVDGSSRFRLLADWEVNDEMRNHGSDGAGYDANCGYMGVEKWNPGDAPITNGKIYQTFTLPQGEYLVEANLPKVALISGTYILAATGNTLPDLVSIENALGATEITNEYNGKTVSTSFSLNTDQQTSIGFLINITDGSQLILQANKIRMFRLESFFD